MKRDQTDADRDVIGTWLLAVAVIAVMLVVAFGMITGCVTPAPPPPNPPPTPATCVKACDHLRRDLLCDTGEGCAELCVRVGDQRFTDCLAVATTCAGADVCDSR
jgi:hypothetical protein